MTSTVTWPRRTGRPPASNSKTMASSPVIKTLSSLAPSINLRAVVIDVAAAAASTPATATDPSARSAARAVAALNKCGLSVHLVSRSRHLDAAALEIASLSPAHCSVSCLRARPTRAEHAVTHAADVEAARGARGTSGSVGAGTDAFGDRGLPADFVDSAAEVLQRATPAGATARQLMLLCNDDAAVGSTVHEASGAADTEPPADAAAVDLIDAARAAGVVRARLGSSDAGDADGEPFEAPSLEEFVEGAASLATRAHAHAVPRSHTVLLRWRLTGVCGVPGICDPEVAGFGPFAVPTSQLFANTALAFATTNLKPVVPGHCLVVPRRRVPRFSNLTAAEVHDVWTLAQRVGAMLQAHHGADSLTYAMQDGVNAGQTGACVAQRSAHCSGVRANAA